MLADGTLAFVQTFRDYFTLNKSSTATADGLTVIATNSGTGRWERLRIPHPSWLRQVTWFVDAVNGSDENTGVDLANAIKTDAERQRRFGSTSRIPGGTSLLITYASDLPITDPINGDFRISTGASLRIAGTPTVLRTSTLTGVVALNRASQQRLSLTDSALASWTPYLDKQIYFPSGARAGACAWVAVNISAGAGYFSPARIMSTALGFSSAAAATPVTGDTYQVRSLPTVYLGYVRIIGEDASTGYGSFQATINDLRFVGVYGFLSEIQTRNLVMHSTACNWENVRVSGDTNFLANNCNFTGPGSACYLSSMRVNSGMTRSAISVESQFGVATTIIDDDLLGQGGIGSIYGSVLKVGRACSFDATGRSGIAVRDQGKVSFEPYGSTAEYWGANNGQYALQIDSGCSAQYTAKPTCNAGLGAGREVKVGGTDKLYSALPYVEPANNAMFVLKA